MGLPPIQVKRTEASLSSTPAPQNWTGAGGGVVVVVFLDGVF